MKKFSLILLAAVLLASALTGCGHGESDTPDIDSVQNTSTTTQEPSTATLPDDTSGDSDDSLELLPASYAKNLLSLADTATSNGISYSVLEVQRTKEFGSRTLENLIDLSRGGTDENGNLLGDEDYLFLTIQFTNTTDQTVEILRNQGGLRAITPKDRSCTTTARLCIATRSGMAELRARYFIGRWLQMNPSPARLAGLDVAGLKGMKLSKPCWKIARIGHCIMRSRHQVTPTRVFLLTWSWMQSKP